MTQYCRYCSLASLQDDDLIYCEARKEIMLFGIDSYTKNKMQLPYKLDAKSSDAALREARMCAMTFYPRFSETEKPDVEVVKR